MRHTISPLPPPPPPPPPFFNSQLSHTTANILSTCLRYHYLYWEDPGQFIRWVKPPAMDFCTLETSRDHQSICKGCREIEMLFEVQRRQEFRQSFRLKSQAVPFHASYQELSACARKCITCRVLRQTLLLKQRTPKDVASLKQVATHLYAQLVRDEATLSAKTTLKVSIGKPEGEYSSAAVACMDANAIDTLALPGNPDSPAIHQQAKKWLEDCQENHPECGNLSWSSTNPTRLLHILSDSTVQLIHCPLGAGKITGYVALSYCWGSWDQLTKAEKQIVEDGKTTKYNIQRRSQAFDCAELPATIQDSIVLVYHLGIEYMWIDTLCIVQDDNQDWQHEAALMHEVYGNARFTLCASSSESATEGLLKEREAWSPMTKPCRLYDQWIASFDVSLNDIRANSPLANRAWTLQEEFLSPRILYWSAQRMYWSCSITHHVELVKSRTPSSIAYYQPPRERSMFSEVQVSQRFLKSCRKGQRRVLHESWLDVIESYTRRELSHAQDRFPALSGLASRYYLAQKGDEYMAGLWRKTFAEDLTWRVTEPKLTEKGKSLREIAPSWSWASLPLRTSTNLKHEFTDCPDFELLHDRSAREDEHPDTAVTRGGNLKSVKVRGRLRPFICKGSMNRPWTEISRKIGDQEKFSFATYVEFPAHSVDLAQCRLLSYEARKEEALGQLDYLEDAYRVEKGLLDVDCLEIGESFMLLLEPDTTEPSGTGPNRRYLRIGISRGYREDFFTDTPLVELNLV
ncbi:hypothetical protein PVAG01_04351 [Phlyctema vagabunda]|uniref:Heterokaryon incompatibility domain-containing protein n=1 Tax=Phlyctema vagabunda TaxID=108571 RepID=A0ABR4PP24_9HELO